MRFLVVLAVLIAGILPAAASGGIWCQLEDQQVRISIESGVTRGMGGPFFNFRGKLEILDKSVAERFRIVDFGADNLPHHWLDDRALKLALYREWQDEPFASLDLVIETQAGDDEGTYGGNYAISIFDNGVAGDDKETKLSGAIDCGAE